MILSNLRAIRKMDAMLKDFETLYDDLGEAKAEGKTSGFNQKSLGCVCHAVSLFVSQACKVSGDAMFLHEAQR